MKGISSERARSHHNPYCLLWVLSVLLFASWATASVHAQPYFPPTDSDDWRTLLPGVGVEPTPQAKQRILNTVGLDWNRLQEAWDYSRQFDSTSALVVIRYGWIAGEWGSTGTPSNVASASKSLTGLAFAKLWDRSDAGLLSKPIGPESRAFEFLPASWGQQDERRQQITIRHLLTMSSGIQPHDQPNDPNYTPQFILGRPMQDQPGEIWAYSSLGVDLSSIVFQDVAEKSVADFLQEQVFEQIGAQVDWQLISGSNFTKASTNARVSARHLARIAYLLLHDGQWAGQQVVSTQYVSLITKWESDLANAEFRQTPGSPFVVETDSQQYYGYLFWTNRTGVALGQDTPADASYGHGFGEDHMIVIPSMRMVVVRVGSQPRSEEAAPFRGELMNRIMRAVVDVEQEFIRGVQIIESVSSDDIVDVFTVPEGVNLRLTDLVISNPNGTSSCCAQVFGDDIPKTIPIVVPAENAVSISLSAGTGITPGTIIRLRNGDGAGVLDFTLRGYLAARP